MVKIFDGERDGEHLVADRAGHTGGRRGVHVDDQLFFNEIRFSRDLHGIFEKKIGLMDIEKLRGKEHPKFLDGLAFQPVNIENECIRHRFLANETSLFESGDKFQYYPLGYPKWAFFHS